MSNHFNIKYTNILTEYPFRDSFYLVKMEDNSVTSA